MHTHRDWSQSATPLFESVLVCGDSRVSLTDPELRGLVSEDRTVMVAYASEMRHTVTWTRVPVFDLFADAGLDDETTYPLVESADGYWVCVDVYATLDVVVAYVRDGTPISEEHGYETRFITPDADGSRTVRSVRVVEALALDPAADPESLEDIFKKP